MAGTRLALGLLTLTCLTPLASADILGRVDVLPDVTITVDCRETVTCAVIDVICTHYTSSSGKDAVGFGDSGQRGAYVRGEYDGENWHYHGIGVAMEMRC